MAIGAVLGAAFHAFAPRLAPAIAKEGITSALSRKGASMVANRLTSYTATASGQRLVARAAGTRFATRLAEHEGTQKLAKYAVKKEVNQRVQGEGQYAPVAPQKVVNINAGTSTVPRSVNDPSTMNVTGANDPVIQQQAQERAARQQGGRNIGRRGSAASGWGGTGRGWWEQNSQITQADAFNPSSVTTLGKFDVARGPTSWAHSLGKGLGRNTVARAAGFREGYKAVSNEEPSFDPVNTAGVPSRNAELSDPSSHKSVMYQQPTPGQSTPAPEQSDTGTRSPGRAVTSGTTESTTPKKTSEGSPVSSSRR